VLNPFGAPAPAGVPGEICLGGAGLAAGYWSQPGEYSKRCVQALWTGDSSARLYRTGDLGRLRDDGLLEFLGRLDHQLKVRGFRIEPEEIEAVLTTCRGVAEAAVMLVPAAADSCDDADALAAALLELPDGERLLEDIERDAESPSWTPDPERGATT
jgi:acyl-CoA synthetase (AMP-forming)/AMP-acid ligase II